MSSKKKKRKQLGWHRYMFDYTHERNRMVTGKELSTVSFNEGKQKLFRGICIEKRSKRLGLMRASYVLRRTLFGYHFFVDFPFYLLDLTDVDVVGFSYSRKITTSRLKGRSLI